MFTLTQDFIFLISNKVPQHVVIPTSFIYYLSKGSTISNYFIIPVSSLKNDSFDYNLFEIDWSSLSISKSF